MPKRVPADFFVHPRPRCRRLNMVLHDFREPHRLLAALFAGAGSIRSEDPWHYGFHPFLTPYRVWQPRGLPRLKAKRRFV